MLRVAAGGGPGGCWGLLHRGAGAENHQLLEDPKRERGPKLDNPNYRNNLETDCMCLWLQGRRVLALSLLADDDDVLRHISDRQSWSQLQVVHAPPSQQLDKVGLRIRSIQLSSKK